LCEGGAASKEKEGGVGSIVTITCVPTLSRGGAFLLARAPFEAKAMLAWLCGSVLAMAVVLGGGTHAGFLGDVAIQITAIPLLAHALWLGLGSSKVRPVLLLIGSLFFCFISIQLVPLSLAPPSLHGTLPLKGMETVIGNPESAWYSLSAAPQATWAAVASLIVPAAIFLAAIQLTNAQRLTIYWLLLALGGVSLALGFLQAGKGAGAALHFYEVTNPTEAVGFFANRNHFAAYLFVTLVLGAVWHLRVTHQMLKTSVLTSRSIFWLAAAAVFIVAILAGLAMARSRAGIILAMVAIFGIWALVARQRPLHGFRLKGSSAALGRLSIATLLFAALFAAQFGLGGILARFNSDLADDLRVTLASTTAATAFRSLPFGTGLGSFVPVYATVEKEEAAAFEYANRAHNDLAEILLETGIVGLGLLVAFLFWFVRRTYRVWTAPIRNDHNFQVTLQRSATLIILLLLAHSLVDYPLRTTALSSILVFFCAVLATDAPVAEQKFVEPKRRAPIKSPASQTTQAEKWGEKLHWPEGWRRKDE
jgi:O-antigen ligase